MKGFDVCIANEDCSYTQYCIVASLEASFNRSQACGCFLDILLDVKGSAVDKLLSITTWLSQNILIYSTSNNRISNCKYCLLFATTF